MAGHKAFMIAVLVVVSGLLFPRCCTAARPSPPSSDDLTRSQNLVPFFVGVGVFSAVVFCVMLILSIILCLTRSYQRNRRRLHSFSGEEEGIFDDDIAWERPGISAKELERIPERLYYAEVKELLVGKRAVECAVCLCDFEDNERLRLLPGCSHAFHRDCIDTWLSSHLTCPSCRADIVAALAASGKEEGGTAAGDSNSSRETSEPRHEVVVVVDPAVVAAEQEEEKEDRKRKEVHELLDLGRRMRQSCPRVVGGGEWPPELPCPPSRSVGYCTERKLEEEFFVIGLDEF